MVPMRWTSYEKFVQGLILFVDRCNRGERRPEREWVAINSGHASAKKNHWSLAHVMIYLPEVAATSGHVERQRPQRKTFHFVSSGSPNFTKSQHAVKIISSLSTADCHLSGAWKYTSSFIYHPRGWGGGSMSCYSFVRQNMLCTWKIRIFSTRYLVLWDVIRYSIDTRVSNPTIWTIYKTILCKILI